MQKTGPLFLALLAALGLSSELSAQRGGRSSGGGESRGSSSGRDSGGSSRGSSSWSGGSSGSHSGAGSSNGGSRVSGSSHGGGSRGSYERPDVSPPARSSSSGSSAPSSRGSEPRYDPEPRYETNRGGDRAPAREPRGESSVPSAPPSSDSTVRYTAPAERLKPLPDAGERRRFPGPYQSAAPLGRLGSVSASPSRRGTSDLTRLVDRYRAAKPDTGGSTTRTPPAALERHRGEASARGSSDALQSGQRGPGSQRTAPSAPERRSGDTSKRLEPRGESLVTERGAPARPRAERGQGEGQRDPVARGAQSLAKLGARDPEAARRIARAGARMADATSLGLASGVGAIAGPAAGAAVRSATYSSGSSDDDYGCFYFGYGSYPWWSGSSCDWDWWWGWSFSFGCGSYGGWYSSCWSPFWSCAWYPFYCYSYSNLYPYYCKPYYYYPLQYSTIVHHVYEDYDPDVAVVREAAPAEALPAEPVGEAVAAARPADSPTKLTLNVAADRYLTLGDSAFRDGRFADAAQFYAKAVEYAPEHGVLHLVLADALFATGDYHYAAYSLRRALELDPALAEAVVDKHGFYSDPADFDRHLARAEIFVRENPADSDARLVLAANYLFGNRAAAAVDLLEADSGPALRADSAARILIEAARNLQFGPEVETP
jgi:hypothetical protein